MHDMLIISFYHANAVNSHKKYTGSQVVVIINIMKSMKILLTTFIYDAHCMSRPVFASICTHLDSLFQLAARHFIWPPAQLPIDKPAFRDNLHFVCFYEVDDKIHLYNNNKTNLMFSIMPV